MISRARNNSYFFVQVSLVFVFLFISSIAESARLARIKYDGEKRSKKELELKLFEAVENSTVEEVESLLRAGASVCSKNMDRRAQGRAWTLNALAFHRLVRAMTWENRKQDLQVASGVVKTIAHVGGYDGGFPSYYRLPNKFITDGQQERDDFVTWCLLEKFGKPVAPIIQKYAVSRFKYGPFLLK